MLEYMRSHTRGGERKKVGRAVRSSCGEFRKAFGKPYAGAGAERHQLAHYALGDVGRRQEGHGAIVGRQRQHGGGHVDVDDERGVRDQTHLGFAGGAGGHVEHR